MSVHHHMSLFFGRSARKLSFPFDVEDYGSDGSRRAEKHGICLRDITGTANLAWITFSMADLSRMVWFRLPRPPPGSLSGPDGAASAASIHQLPDLSARADIRDALGVNALIKGGVEAEVSDAACTRLALRLGGVGLCIAATAPAHVAVGSISSSLARPPQVRSTPINGNHQIGLVGPVHAMNGQLHPAFGFLACLIGWKSRTTTRRWQGRSKFSL
jgi:hypothetical protein